MLESVASLSTQMLHDLGRLELPLPRKTEITDEVMRQLWVLSRIQDLLKYAHDSEGVLTNIEKIRHLAYEIEDVLETCVVEVTELMSQKKDKKGIKRYFSRSSGVRNDVAALEEIISKISVIEPEIISFLQIFSDDASENIGRGAELRTGNQSIQLPKQINPRRSEEPFFGMEDLAKLVSLDAQERQCRVISIWGVKGLGKTYIAREFFYHPEVRKRFKAFAWVNLTQVCQISILLQDILGQLGPEKVKEITEERSMVGILNEIQRQKDCLIVLDGISEIDQWQQISCAFQMEGVGTRIRSRILLTTRQENIANVGLPHKLSLLNEDEGWELLKRHAFPRRNAPDIGVIPQIGKEMVRKCGYLPLAISNLGRNLNSKISLSEWDTVNDDLAKYLQSEYHTEADQSSFNNLQSNYDGLWYYLKQCFLYLGTFREDEDIDAVDVIFLWMAEGMVPSVDQERERTMMEIADSYLTRLASSGMELEVDEFSATRRFKLCCLHSLARELSLSQGEKEDFRLKVLDFCDGKKPMLDSSTLRGGTRRMVIHFDKHVELQPQELVANGYLRSLLFLNSDEKYADIPVRITDIRKFKLLKVVHFVRCKFEGRKLPQGIDELVNLMYFGLLYCDLDELPSSISNLRKLHVLNVVAYNTAPIAIATPDFLSRMILLKHLRLPDYSDHEEAKKLILDGLLELETLVGFNCLIHDLSSLAHLKNLRHLVTHAYSNDSLTSIMRFVKSYGVRVRTSLCIENKCNFTSPEVFAVLEEVLMCPNLHALTLSLVRIYKFPDCGMHSSVDLKELKLIGCKIREDPMEALGKFLNLQKLWLGYGAFVGREMIIHDKGFPNLNYLEFRSLPNLVEWNVDGGAMRNLSNLTIRRCPKLERIPSGLTSISTLSNLDIELAPKAFAEGQKAKYYQKFAFVRSCIFRELDPFSRSFKNSH